MVLVGNLLCILCFDVQEMAKTVRFRNYRIVCQKPESLIASILYDPTVMQHQTTGVLCKGTVSQEQSICIPLRA